MIPNHPTLKQIIEDSFQLKNASEHNIDFVKTFKAISHQQENETLLNASISSAIHNKENKGKIIFTHDIDWLNPLHPYAVIKSVMGNWYALKSLSRTSYFLENIVELIAFEKHKNISSVFLIGSETFLSSLKRFAIRYPLHHKLTAKLIELLSEQNLQTGFHPSATNEHKWCKQKTTLEQLIGQPVRYHRSHFLRSGYEHYYQILDNNQIRYDLSIGYARKTGFKYGIAHPYKPYDIFRQQLSQTTVIPLLLCDNIFFVKPYAQIMQEFEQAAQTISELGGCVNILFHPENFLLKPVLWKAYEEIIDICDKTGIDTKPL